ncbi:D-isomer specific 2-hydroxyacid dehydrogenase family protein [Aldersonia sp. NBC_00410]|uniref:D-isomer specific 2-hydroxyacid dehydrogenase family protein n=1 Tax=Aldersonia sp. NBC_00410 TaxID=2975954 RepID=UPI00225909B2|nr:D-isomer specific 2-hydroxyacid dehydrogenase family protein [Aldersonia sp. NBC_00410]MCX5042778.1 D-isomer specific 2-hydroxyacid dehydrogenase family protein [Aldersonia sp. NBC_00410]
MPDPTSTARTQQPVPIALGPNGDRLLSDAIGSGGATLTDLAVARALVWDGGTADFPVLPDHVRWVQLNSAGVEHWFATDVFQQNPHVVFTSAVGAFAASVAEHALMLLLAGVRQLPEHLRADSWRPAELAPRIGTLRDATVTILGAGGIGRALIPMLTPLGAHVIAVNRTGTPVPGAMETVAVAQVSEVWEHTDHLVIAAPATPATKHLVERSALAALKPHSWVVNVARGDLLDTDAAVDALRAGTIGGVGLDVTDPEPLPDGHPLWSLPNVIITPHDSNPPQRRVPAFAERVAANVARFVAGQELIGVIDTTRGY